MLEYIITSKTRRKILAFFFNNPGVWYHMRRIGREVGEEINAVKRELDILEKAGLLLREKRLNKVLFCLNEKYINFHEFLAIFTKSSPIAQQCIKNISRLGKVKSIVLSEKFALREKIPDSEIYILVIGTVVVAEVVQIIKSQQETFPHEINYTVMTAEEFAFRKKNKDPFIWNFLHQPNIMIIGNPKELLS